MFMSFEVGDAIHYGLSFIEWIIMDEPKGIVC
jgi:hypothetical protein